MNLTHAMATASDRSVFSKQAVVKAFGQVGGPYWCEALNEAIPQKDIVAVFENGVVIPYLQPCGHPVTAIVSTDEGTRYCGDCAKAAEFRHEEETK